MNNIVRYPFFFDPYYKEQQMKEKDAGITFLSYMSI